jgi:hypothetical protein
MKVGDYYIRNSYNWNNSDNYISFVKTFHKFELVCEITKISNGFIRYYFLSGADRGNTIECIIFLQHFDHFTVVEKEKLEEQYKNETMIKDIIE